MTTTTTAPAPTKQHRQFVGRVVSASMRKTITVRLDTMKQHAKYQKAFRVSRNYHVHDEQNTAAVGDTVVFRECRPLSKTKRWYLVKVLTV